MSAAKALLQSQAETLRKKLAGAEATVEILRGKLGKIEEQLTGAPAPVTGLDLLWKAALPVARNRSSKHLCRKAMNLIPRDERPTIEVMLHAIKVWNRCLEWKKDGNQFVPALDRWIRERRWEDLPEVAEAGSRYRNPTKAIAQTPPEEAATPEEIAALMTALRPPRMNS